MKTNATQFKKGAYLNKALLFIFLCLVTTSVSKANAVRLPGGQGVLLDEQFILTAHHVMGRSKSTRITFKGQTRTATTVMTWVIHDLSVLKLDRPIEGVEYVNIGRTAYIGTECISNRYRAATGPLIQINTKVIGMAFRKTCLISCKKSYFFRMSKPVEPGGSGSGLFTLDHELIGICSYSNSKNSYYSTHKNILEILTKVGYNLNKVKSHDVPDVPKDDELGEPLVIEGSTEPPRQIEPPVEPPRQIEAPVEESKPEQDTTPMETTNNWLRQVLRVAVGGGLKLVAAEAGIYGILGAGAWNLFKFLRRGKQPQANTYYPESSINYTNNLPDDGLLRMRQAMADASRRHPWLANARDIFEQTYQLIKSGEK